MRNDFSIFSGRSHSTKLVVGLGNPGSSYANNRHNVGFMCLNHFARLHGIKLDKARCKARIGTGYVNGEQVVVAKPQTFMNLSGESVGRLVRKFNVSLKDLVVIHDDLDLPLGKIRIRSGSSAGGHKGAKSIIACLGGDKEFVRLRIGIGRSSEQMTEDDVVNYVLSNFSRYEKKVIEEIILKACEAIRCFLTEDLIAVMNKYN
ncbi:aminoacyl-tRNA hydrolase [Chloroflexota bacterium]